MQLPGCSSSVYTFVILASFISDTISTPMPQSQPSNTLLRRAAETDCHKVDSRLPTNFECKIQDSTCISIDDGSSAMCCAEQDCKVIAPFTCDVERQDVKKHPTSPVLTTLLDRNLPTCGSACCPFGYDCITPATGDPFCSMIVSKSSLAKKDDSSSSSAASATLATSSATSTTTASVLPATTTASLASTIDSKSHGESENPFPPGVFLAGLFPGMVVGALLLLAWVIFSGRQKKTPSGSRRHSASSGRPMISDPIPMTGGMRSDFSRRFQDRLSKAKSTFSSTDSNPWKNPTPPVPNNVPERPAGVPQTPINRDREPSLHSIRVYSPPSMMQHPSATVPPLRSMTTHRRQPTVDQLGSPYVTPQKATYDYVSPIEPSETLGSERYDAPLQPRSKKENQRYEDSEENKRDTSFTALMAHCNIPDRGDEFPVPRVPDIHKPYETRY
jgi:hypothetical protein